MDIRRTMMGVIAQMGSGDTTLWKTVILDADMTNDVVAAVNPWKSFLGINDNDLDSYVVVALFRNNTQPTYSANMIVWTKNTSDTVVAISVRQDWSNSGMGNRSMYATSGTIIDIYRLTKQ